ncbi:binding-protein-dependent transport system inner membrane component [Bradyrhizobium daqingense]|uniref:Binding-protein-dependent transport system inner membrane component n=1 Tax=Bradyrhizobium daqingense TaxID=993502 RepID=A0A562KWK8_9BRAD|nr:binding-protein-dependent transport system inner membrane component [Bradyrhizobium daqingense]
MASRGRRWPARYRSGAKARKSTRTASLPSNSGTPSLIFVIVHSVLWPVALACYGGFLAVPPTLRMAGRNLGLSGGRFVAEILVPAAFPQILSGLRIGWAFAWRTLIAAELVFGVSARSGGIGWFICTSRAQLETASVFAGLLTVILIGLLVEGVIFSEPDTDHCATLGPGSNLGVAGRSDRS